jgi:gluconolactonase
VLKDERPGVPDGMKVDLDGNLYCTGPGGVWIIDPSGKHMGTIALGDGKRATNLAWGGGDWKTFEFILIKLQLYTGPSESWITA